MPSAPMQPEVMCAHVDADLVLPILLPPDLCSAKVTVSNGKQLCRTSDITNLLYIVVDICSVNNGGCDINADCSHAAGSDVCICKCRPGFVNTATTGPVVCKGNAF